MYNYKIGYSWEEDSQFIEIIHKDNISKEEFENMVAEATLEVLIDKRKNYKWLNYYEEGEKGDFSQRFTIFSDILNEVVDVIIEKYGFKKLEYERIIEFPGRTDIVNPNNIYSETEDQDYDVRGHESVRILDRIRKKYWERRKEKELKDKNKFNLLDIDNV